MKPKLQIVLASILGSFVIYCTSSTNGPSETSFVPDAHADSPGGACCNAVAPKFKKLAEGALTKANTPSPIIPVGNYREVVVYTNGSFMCQGNGVVLTVGPESIFRPDADTAFGSTGQNLSSGGRARVDGVDMEVVVRSPVGTTCGGGVSYVVAGVE
ncbi:hypothetical protein LVJ94_06345 [Pendulispora rubella]|uniref:Uncharacterized protein n=1 Tax=Pendulispora rubella TaxID=2741070 RepID=A0ABZ2LAB1_9BACT